MLDNETNHDVTLLPPRHIHCADWEGLEMSVINRSVTIILCLIAAVTFTGVTGLTKEDVMKRVAVRLVKKDWRPKGFDPPTDEPLSGFPGNHTQLYNIFRVYKNFEFVSRPMETAAELFDDPNYNASRPSVVLTHPLTIGDSAFIKYTVAVFSLRNLQKYYNVFALHAPWLSWHFQVTCMQTLFGLKTMFEPMAEGFAHFMLQGIAAGKLWPEQLSFIGFSYAATLNGYIGRYIFEQTGHKVHTILALDAFAHNYHNTYFKQLSAEDALYVHLLHSSSGFGGTFDRIGTVDVVLNNGYLQPGCDGYFSVVGCSHRRSVALFMFALLVSGNVRARACESWERFVECGCSDDEVYPTLIVSFPVNQEARGTFYLRTTKDMPYALGKYGADCVKVAKKKMKRDETPPNNTPAE